MGLIDDLKNEGALVLYHDYRSGSVRDWSGNDNDGTATDVQWTNDGIRFPSGTSRVQVADSNELQFTTGTIVFFGDFMLPTATKAFVMKRDGDGTQWQINVTDTSIVIFDGSGTVSLGGVLGKSYTGINFASGGTPEGFADGIKIGNFSGTVTITADTATVRLGSQFDNSANFNVNTGGLILVNRELTETEHSKLYAELEARTLPRKTAAKVQDDIDASLATAVEFKTDWGAAETVAAVTGGLLSNTPFEVTGGQAAVVIDTTGGEEIKAIEATGATTLKIHWGTLNDDNWTGWLDTGSGYVETNLSTAHVSSMVITLADGDKLALGAVDGKYSIVKTLG